jgi:HD-like signal output (HDOD) protein
MWNKLKGLVRTSTGGAAAARQATNRKGESTISVETTREVVIAQRIDRAFCGELLGVRSFIDGVNPLEVRVMKRVDRLLGRSSDFVRLVPRVPAVLPRLMRSIRNDDLSGNQLASVLSQDVVLVADVIRFANSAYYRTREPIKNLEHAVAILGRDGLSSLVARVAFRSLLNSHRDHYSTLAGPLLWRQAERCALACECIARRSKVPVFEAFLAGLIHKVGYKIVARILSEEHQGADAPRSAQFRDWLIARAPALSWRVAAQWDLSETLTEALRGLAGTESRADGTGVAGVVYVSSKLSELYLLAAAGRIRGEIKRFNCRVNGELADYCRACYAEMARLDEAD